MSTLKWYDTFDKKDRKAISELKTYLNENIIKYRLYSNLAFREIEKNNIPQAVIYCKRVDEAEEVLKKYCQSRYSQQKLEGLLWDKDIPEEIWNINICSSSKKAKDLLFEKLKSQLTNPAISIEDGPFLQLYNTCKEFGMNHYIVYERYSNSVLWTLLDQGFKKDIDVLHYAMTSLTKEDISDLSMNTYFFAVFAKPNSFLSRRIKQYFSTQVYAVFKRICQEKDLFRQYIIIKNFFKGSIFSELENSSRFYEYGKMDHLHYYDIKSLINDDVPYYLSQIVHIKNEYIQTMADECIKKHITVRQAIGYEAAYVFSDGMEEIIVLESSKKDFKTLSAKLRENKNTPIFQIRSKKHTAEYAKEIVSFASNEFHTSFMERCAGEVLRKRGISYKREVKIGAKDINDLPYDIGFRYAGKNCLIETDGIQHSKPIDFFGGQEAFKIRCKHDVIKNNYAKENNYELLRIKPNDNIEACIDAFLAEITTKNIA